jgi:hypothetical protein
VAVAGAAYGAWHWGSYSRFIESTDNAYIGADITVVAPKVTGYITSMAVTDNSRSKRAQSYSRSMPAITAPRWRKPKPPCRHAAPPST